MTKRPAPLPPIGVSAPTMRDLAPRLWAAQQRESVYQERLSAARAAGRLPLDIEREERARARRHAPEPRRGWLALGDAFALAGLAMAEALEPVIRLGEDLIWDPEVNRMVCMLAVAQAEDRAVLDGEECC